MDFFTFYTERCKAHNNALKANPGIHLPESGALALNDFLSLRPSTACCQENMNKMTFRKLVDEEHLQQIQSERLEAGEKIELKSVISEEK